MTKGELLECIILLPDDIPVRILDDAHSLSNACDIKTILVDTTSGSSTGIFLIYGYDINKGVRFYE